jgi:hypothetical protein
MQFENDFVKEDLIEFEIEGRKFKYKPVTAGEESGWIDEYMEIVDGKPKQNLQKLTACKIRNLIEVPYDLETIKKIIGIEKEWKGLNKEEKWKLLSKLKPGTFDKIIKKINSLDSSTEEQKKN